MTRIKLYDGAQLAVYYHDADPAQTAASLAMYWYKGVARNVALSFPRWPWGNGLVDSWAIVGADGQILDSGRLSRERKLKRGDRLVFPRGNIKSAMVGDVLGITAVFMPSGFTVGVVPPVATPGGFLGGTLGDFAYAGQDELVPARPFWLPKRRWAEMPGYLDELGQWQKRLSRPEVGVRETVRRREQELVVAGVL